MTKLERMMLARKTALLRMAVWSVKIVFGRIVFRTGDASWKIRSLSDEHLAIEQAAEALMPFGSRVTIETRD